jgi:hypothetical protein
MLSDVGSTTSVRAKRALALVRIVIGAMFVWVFFENYGKGLYTPAGYANLIDVYATRGHAPEAWKSVMRLMAANAAVAAPLQATAAFGFLTSLWVSEWGTAWIWELLVPMGAVLAVSLGAAGRTWGIDGLLARRNPDALWW